MTPRFLARIGGAALLTTATLAAGLAPTLAPAARADVTRCVGVDGTPPAFACYTSPRFNHSGFDNTTIAEFPTVCYVLACSTPNLIVWTPDDDNLGTGRFTSVVYFGHTYTVYRPADSQPFIFTSDNPRIAPAESAQVLVISAALDASSGG